MVLIRSILHKSPYAIWKEKEINTSYFSIFLDESFVF